MEYLFYWLGNHELGSRVVMNLKMLRNNLEFAKRAGFDEIYIWGVEWWYWLKEEKANSEFWDSIVAELLE